MKALQAALAGIYDIEAQIGRGGMGVVYRAREKRLDRRVALKVLAPELAADEAYRNQFLSEARTVARLTHPNIVPIFTVDQIGGYVFFAMAYVAGDTLFERVTASGPLAPEVAARMVCDIGEALDYAHARGVIHRDVKPDNILLEAVTGRALLTDFGIAHTSAGGRGLLRRPAAPGGSVIGTAPFMSPEQASGATVDARSDIYALGVAAYYALAGQLPFDAATDEAVSGAAHQRDATAARFHGAAGATATCARGRSLSRQGAVGSLSRRRGAPLLPSISLGAAATALLAAIVARARTEQRTDPLGERSLRFWRGPLGAALFRIAGLQRDAAAPIVKILDHLETHA